MLVTSLALALLFALAAPARADVERFSASGGLRVAASVERAAPVVTVATVHQVGSADEAVGGEGGALLVAHALAEAKVRGRDERQRDVIEAVGGRRSVHAGVEVTAIVDVVPAERLELVLWLAGERLRTTELEPATARAVERSLEEDARARLRALAFAGHPWGRDARLDRAAPSLVPRFGPARAALVVVGDYEPGALRAAVEHYLGGIVAAPEPPGPIAALAEQRTRRTGSWRQELAQRALAAHGWVVPGRGRPEHAAARVAVEVARGRLEADLVRGRAESYRVIAGDERLREQDLVWLLAELPRGVAPAQASAAIERHVRELGLQAPSAEELAVAVQRWRTRARLELQESALLAVRLGEAELLDGNAAAFARELELAPSAEQVRAAAAELMPHRAAVVELLPAPWRTREPAREREPEKPTEPAAKQPPKAQHKAQPQTKPPPKAAPKQPRPKQPPPKQPKAKSKSAGKR